MLAAVSDDTELVLRVVRGEPTAAELAALVTVLSARAASTQPSPMPRPSSWAAYWNEHRAPVAPGAGAWRASVFPH